MLSCEYKAIYLLSDQRRSVEDSSACFVLKINDFIKSESVLLVLKNIKSVVEWVMIINQK